jgi:ribosomal-protein-alanine N-acetyltransferase
MHQSDSDLIITTERLVIRLPRPSDVGRLVAFVIVNQNHLATWEPDRGDVYFTELYWQEEIEHARLDYIHDRGLRLILMMRDDPTGNIVGRINYNNIVRGVFQACHLGYAAGEAFQGKGLMFEAITATNVFVFEELCLHRIMANYMPCNQRSASLLKRLGFTEEGLARDYLKIAGRWEDHVLTSLINPHFECDKVAHE